MNYVGIVGIATTIVFALTGYFSSANATINNKIDSVVKDVNQDRVNTADRLGRIETNTANIITSLEELKKVKK